MFELNDTVIYIVVTCIVLSTLCGFLCSFAYNACYYVVCPCALCFKNPKSFVKYMSRFALAVVLFWTMFTLWTNSRVWYGKIDRAVYITKEIGAFVVNNTSPSSNQ